MRFYLRFWFIYRYLCKAESSILHQMHCQNNPPKEHYVAASRKVVSYLPRLVSDHLHLYNLKVEGCHNSLVIIGRPPMLFLNAVWFEEGSQGLWSLLSFFWSEFQKSKTVQDAVRFVLKDSTENKSENKIHYSK